MTALTVGELQQRVDRGVEWLDANIPDWWAPGRIDLNRLDMVGRCSCVLGQLLGDYYNAPVALDEAVRLGFDVATPAMTDASTDEWQAAMAEEFDALTELWSRVIEARRAAVPPDRS